MSSITQRRMQSSTETSEIGERCDTIFALTVLHVNGGVLPCKTYLKRIRSMQENHDGPTYFTYSSKSSKNGFDWFDEHAYEIVQQCLDEGFLAEIAFDTYALTEPGLELVLNSSETPALEYDFNELLNASMR